MEGIATEARQGWSRHLTAESSSSQPQGVPVRLGCRSETWGPGGIDRSGLSQTVFEKVELAESTVQLALGLSVLNSVGLSLKIAALEYAGRALDRKAFVLWLSNG